MIGRLATAASRIPRNWTTKECQTECLAVNVHVAIEHENNATQAANRWVT